MVKLYLIGWAVVLFGTYDSMGECLGAENRINAREYYYKNYDTLCLEIPDVDAIGNGSVEHKSAAAYLGTP